MKGRELSSYNMLLSRSWWHKNGVVPSTWHQCFKYYRGDVVKKIDGDHKPFMESESYFADAKYFLPSKKVIKATENVHVEKVEEKTPLVKEESSEGLTVPLIKIDMKRPTPPPLEGFVQPSQDSTTEYGEVSEC